jgi:hypothetical protein
MGHATLHPCMSNNYLILKFTIPTNRTFLEESLLSFAQKDFKNIILKIF